MNASNSVDGSYAQERPRDRATGRWVSYARKMGTHRKLRTQHLEDELSEIPSEIQLREMALSIGIADAENKALTTLMRELAVHSVSAGVEGYANASKQSREYKQSNQYVDEFDMSIGLIKVGHSPRAALAAAVTVPLMA